MTSLKSRRISAAAISVVFLLLLLLPVLPVAAQDQGWPRTITKPGGTIVLYQPQVDDWKNYQQVDARMAFTITPTGGKQHVGAMTVQMQSSTNVADHTVLLSDPKITSTYFPSLDAATTAQMDTLVRSFVNPSATMNISLDRLAASVQKREAPKAADLKNDPPTIFISMKPAILLLVNGAATTAPIANSKIEFVVNANWPVFVEKGKTTYYLFDSKGWMTANGLDGTWTPTAKLPKDMDKVPLNQNFTTLKPFIPPPASSTGAYPVVYYSSTPAEIVVFNGQPQWTAIPGTQLAYASNTDATVFRYNPNGAFYYLTSGRWFTAQGPMGPWTFATYSLPADFKNIPPASPQGKVLASVPGTPEAEDAVLIAQIPTTATVTPAAAQQVKVSYAGGTPQFQPITGTSMSYAVNTQEKVIQVGNEYYLCANGVWFVSFNATGPWQLAQSVPQAIYTIPPSSPVYNVTYVTQVPASDGNVTASYTAGYMGAFVMGATVGAIVCSGTGWYYPPYMYGGFYYPYAWTYGYHPYYYGGYTYGAYGYHGYAYGPYGGATWGAGYNPATGTYARGGTAYTPYGTRSAAQAYNPYTNTYAATRQGSNAYSQWGQSVVSHNGNTAYTQHYSNANGTAASAQTSKGGYAAGVNTAHGTTAAGKTSNGDMYAGHDGNVYKNTGSGWEKYDNGSWNTVQKPTTNPNYANAQQKADSYQQSHPTGTQDASQARASGASGSWDRSGSGGSWGDLQQQAQDRQRGDWGSQRYNDAQHSGWGGGADRSAGGWGGDRWGGGGGGRSFGGGGGFRR